MSQPETTSARGIRSLLSKEILQSHPNISAQELNETNLEMLIQLSENPRLKTLREFQLLESLYSVETSEGREKRYTFLWEYLKLGIAPALIIEAAQQHVEKAKAKEQTQPALSREHRQLATKLLECAEMSLKLYD